MRRAISIVLAAILVTTPLKMVLAQAAQQEAVSVQQTVPPDSSGHRLIGVPPVTDNTSRLWEPLASKDALAGIFAYDDSETRVPAPQGGGGGSIVLVIVMLSLLVALGVTLIILCGDDDFDC